MASASHRGCPRCGKVLQFQKKDGALARCAHCGAQVRIAQRRRVTTASNSLPDSPPASTFGFDESPAGPIIQVERPSRLRFWKRLGIAAMCLAAVAAIIYWNWPQLRPHWEEYLALVRDRGPVAAVPPQVSRATSPITDSNLAAATGPPLPRRLLAISVNNYLYANPIENGLRESPGLKPGEQDRSIDFVVAKLGNALQIPESQITVLSDGANESAACPPLKPVIEYAMTEFLSGCRPQDRVILLFVGHAVEIGDDSYLVPIEGELTVKETLIPLRWVFNQFEKCPAQQKLFIVDVCRLNPMRGLERPGSGPMGTKLDAALKNPPPGVQVWSACAAGQYSLEGPVNLASSVNVVGGFFLTELAEAVGAYQRKVNIGTQSPTDPLPVELLASGDGTEIQLADERIAKGVHSCTAHDAKEWYSRAQTPCLTSRPVTPEVPYDSDAAVPARVVVKPPGVPDDVVADRKVVQQILDETETKMTRDGAIVLQATAFPPFSAATLASYAPDGEMTPFRVEVARAANLVKKHAKTFRDKFDQSPTADAVKKQVLKDQHEPARALAEMLGALETLKELEADKAAENSKRWRAHYDYVVAKLHAHVAYVYEYNFMLGQIRKDALPARSEETLWLEASIDGDASKRLGREKTSRRGQETAGCHSEGVCRHSLGNHGETASGHRIGSRVAALSVIRLTPFAPH